MEKKDTTVSKAKKQLVKLLLSAEREGFEPPDP